MNLPDMKQISDFLKVKQIKTVGVIGAGTMGSALAQKFAQEGFMVYLNDREVSFIEKGLAGITASLEQGVERKILKPEMVERILSHIKGTSVQTDLFVCDLIIEAVYEDFNVKTRLFESIAAIVPSETIIATNTSSFSVTELAKSVSNPGRFIGLHYFYHAAKNRLVEIVPGKETSAETILAAKIFCINTSKDAIITDDTYGFAVNRFFVPWLNEAVKLLDEGVATTAEIDCVAMKTLGIGMGPFALMNATGIAIALHAQNTLATFGPAYAVSGLLEKQVQSGKLWDVPIIENVCVSAEKERIINNRLLGCIFFVCNQILTEEVCTSVDLNRGAKIGLKWKNGPVDLMMHYGEKQVRALIDDYGHIYNEPPLVYLNFRNLEMEFVTLEVFGVNAVITISNPEDLNVLNAKIMDQLEEKFTKAESMSVVSNIFITGSGKAFVAGADVRFFIQNMKSDSIDKIVSFTTKGHKLFNQIDNSIKNVIAVLNGLTLGGGMELALCADTILAFPSAKIAFPETGIGIFPGLGGTQRTVTRIGKGLSKFLVLTGKTLNAREAFDISLIDEIITVEEFYRVIHGISQLKEMQKRNLPEKWKGIEHIFEANNYRSIVDGTYQNGGMDKKDVQELVETLNHKAPVALDVAEELINQAKGTQSEIEKLAFVFSTKDALLGLSSLGKNVEFTGE